MKGWQLAVRSFASKNVARKDGPRQFNLVGRKVDLQQKIPPSVKELINKQMPERLTDTDLALLSQPRYAPDRVLKQIDSSFESFFHQRDYTERNFTFYLQVLAQQHKPVEAANAFTKMLAMGIAPTDQAFTQLMLVYARTNNLERVLELEKEAVEKYKITPSVFRLNSVLLAYARLGRAKEADRFVTDMRDEYGLQPDAVSYTTLIQAHRKVNNLDRCWELFRECQERKKPGQDVDEQLISYMIRISAATHDAEQGMRLFDDLQLDGFIEHSKPYNSIMMACASSQRHAGKAIEYWHTMHAKNIAPDQHTYVAVLKACAQLGDLQTAYDAMHELKLNDLVVNEHIFNQLIKVYAGAAMVPQTLKEHVDAYLNDGLELFSQMVRETEFEPNERILNSLTLLYCNALEPIRLEAEILPFYERFHIKHDVYTYQHICKMYLNLLEIDKVLELYKQALASGIRPNKMLLITTLDAAMRKEDSDCIYEVMQEFVQIGAEPHSRQLRKLSQLKQIPDRLFVLLKKNFQDIGGVVGKELRQFEKPTFRKESEGKLDYSLPKFYKRNRLKKKQTKDYGKKVTKEFNIL